MGIVSYPFSIGSFPLLQQSHWNLSYEIHHVKVKDDYTTVYLLQVVL